MSSSTTNDDDDTGVLCARGRYTVSLLWVLCVCHHNDLSTFRTKDFLIIYGRHDERELRTRSLVCFGVLYLTPAPNSASNDDEDDDDSCRFLYRPYYIFRLTQRRVSDKANSIPKTPTHTHSSERVLSARRLCHRRG